MCNGQECATAVYSFYASHSTFQDFLKGIHHNWPCPQLQPAETIRRLASSVAQSWKNFTEAASNCVTIYFTRGVITIPFSSIMNPKGGLNKTNVSQ